MEKKHPSIHLDLAKGKIGTSEEMEWEKKG